MKRPLTLYKLHAMFLLGILMGSLFLPGVSIVWFLACFLVVGVIILITKGKNSQKVWILLALSLFGMILTFIRLNEPMTPGYYTLQGTITKSTVNAYYGTHTLAVEGGLLYISERGGTAIEKGTKITVEGEVFATSELNYTRDFDYGDYLYKKRYIGAITIDQGAYTITEKPTGLNAFLNDIKSQITDAIDRGPYSSNDEKAVIKAILLGDRDELSKETEALFENTATYHLLAISGLHIGILSAIFFFVLKKLLGPHKRLIILSYGLLLFGYVLMTGARDSVVRAAIMALVVAYGRLFHEDGRMTESLALASFIILIINPLEFFLLEYQLTFICMLGIILILDKKLLGTYRLRYLSPILITLAVNFATLPLQMDTFGHFYPYFVFSNVIAVALGSFIVMIGALFWLVFWIFDPFVIVFDVLYTTAYRLLEVVLRFFANLPGAVMDTSPIPDVLLILFYGMLILLPIIRKKKRTIPLLIAFVLFCTILIAALIPPMGQKEVMGEDFGFATVDVGQGLSQVVLIDGACFVIDTGTEEEAKEALIPYLSSLNVTSIEGVVISHGDSDHDGGLMALLSHFEVKGIYLPEVEDYIHYGNWYLGLGYDVTYLKRGDDIVHGDLTMKVLNPVDTTHKSDNENSIVFSIAYGIYRILLTGDATDFDFDDSIDYDIIVMPHHGDQNESVERLLRTIEVRHAIISYGNNHYGLPRATLVPLLEAYGITVLTTYDEGTIVYVGDGQNPLRHIE